MNAFEIRIPIEKLRTAQIIATALPLGCLTFIAIVAIFLHPPKPPFNLDADMLTLVLIMKAIFLVPASFIVPGIILKTTAKQAFHGINLQEEIERESTKDVPPVQIDKFLQIFQTKMIVGAAILEGIAFFGAVIYLVNQSIISLSIAGVLTVILFTRIPTLAIVQNSLANFAAEQEYEISKTV